MNRITTTYLQRCPRCDWGISLSVQAWGRLVQCPRCAEEFSANEADASLDADVCAALTPWAEQQLAQQDPNDYQHRFHENS